MNFEYSKPKTDSQKSFWNTFYSSSPLVLVIAFFVQLVLFATEGFAFTFWLSKMTGIDILLTLPIGYLIGLCVECINYFTIPIVALCIVNFSKIKAMQSGTAMFIAVFMLGLVSVGSGTYASFDGAKDMNRYFNESKLNETFENANVKIDSINQLKDSLFSVESIEIIERYKRDSTQIESLFKQKEKASKKIIALAYRRGKKDEDFDSEIPIREQQAKIEKEKTDKNEKIISLTSKLDSEKEELKQEIDKQFEEELSIFSNEFKNQEAETAETGRKFGWLTVILQFIYISLHFVLAIFNKGSGREKILLPSNYYYYPSKLKTKLIYLKNKYDSRFYNKIRKKELEKVEQTAIPPIREKFFNTGSEVFKMQNGQNFYREGKKVENYEKSISEEQILKYVRKKEELTAKELISIYLETKNEKKIDDFYEKCIGYLQNKNPNPFRRRGIGFKPSKLSESSESKGFGFSQNSLSNADTGGIGSIQNCQICGNEFEKTANHQILCGSKFCKHQHIANRYKEKEI